MTRLRELLARYREIILYIFFGGCTTLVSWIVYYAVMLSGRALLDIPAEIMTGGEYMALYTAAQVLQWVSGVLFAFFTNRKWVFTDADKSVSMLTQLAKFSGSRLLTFGLDYVITFAGGLALGALFPALCTVDLFGQTRNLAELLAKLVAAVLVIISNYFISKLLVFRK